MRDLFTLWNPGKGERRRRPSWVAGSLRASRMEDSEHVTIQAAIMLDGRHHWITAEGLNGEDAFWNLLERAEEDYRMALASRGLEVDEMDGLGPSTIPLP